MMMIRMMKPEIKKVLTNSLICIPVLLVALHGQAEAGHPPDDESTANSIYGSPVPAEHRNALESSSEATETSTSQVDEGGAGQILESQTLQAGQGDVVPLIDDPKEETQVPEPSRVLDLPGMNKFSLKSPIAPTAPAAPTKTESVSESINASIAPAAPSVNKVAYLRELEGLKIPKKEFASGSAFVKEGGLKSKTLK